MIALSLGPGLVLRHSIRQVARVHARLQLNALVCQHSQRYPLSTWVRSARSFMAWM
jgi:hypothetical protein